MEAPHQSDGADLEEIWSSPGGLFASRETSQCPFLFSQTHPATFGQGIAMAEASFVCLPHF